MISEQEARSAAEVVRSATDHEETEWRDHNWSILAQYAIQELARREAERAERSKPIDAEWLNEILGSQWSFESPTLGGAMVTIWRTKLIKSGWGLGILHRSTETVHCLNATTRGQLLDMLAALKGGEP